MKSLRSKFVGALVGVGAFVGVANAQQVIVFEGPFDTSNQKISANFAVNCELGRAWIDVQIRPTFYYGEGLPEPTVIMTRVDGLFYDSARKQVLYQTGAEPIVCAEDATFLLTTYLKNTGQCQLTSSTRQRNVDDGFNLQGETVAKVVFDAQTSSAGQQAAAPQR